MAIDIEAARFLLAAAKSGVSFEHSIMLGRQSYLLGKRETRGLMQAYGRGEAAQAGPLAQPYGVRYAEPFFEALGARQVESMDACSFEGATVVHDLNQPVGAELRNRFDVVYDGGTLEHVFNFTTGVNNIAGMLKVGGRAFLHTPANNFFGHGFFQFSPELFFRVFSKANGFATEHLVAVEYSPQRRWYQVHDPASIAARTPLICAYPVLLLIQVRKTEEKALFLSCPQQSDYSSMWQEVGNQPARSAPPPPPDQLLGVKRALIERAPALARWLEAFLFSRWIRAYSFKNRSAFTPVDKRSFGL
jgi:SAM-dependent methyltransferase